MFSLLGGHNILASDSNMRPDLIWFLDTVREHEVCHDREVVLDWRDKSDSEHERPALVAPLGLGMV